MYQYSDKHSVCAETDLTVRLCQNVVVKIQPYHKRDGQSKKWHDDIEGSYVPVGDLHKRTHFPRDLSSLPPALCG